MARFSEMNKMHKHLFIKKQELEDEAEDALMRLEQGIDPLEVLADVDSDGSLGYDRFWYARPTPQKTHSVNYLGDGSFGYSAGIASLPVASVSPVVDIDVPLIARTTYGPKAPSTDIRDGVDAELWFGELSEDHLDADPTMVPFSQLGANDAYVDNGVLVLLDANRPVGQPGKNSPFYNSSNTSE